MIFIELPLLSTLASDSLVMFWPKIQNLEFWPCFWQELMLRGLLYKSTFFNLGPSFFEIIFPIFQIPCSRTFPSFGNSNSSSKQHNSPLKVATSSRRGLQDSIQSHEKNILVSSPHITLFLCYSFFSSLWTTWIFLIYCFGALYLNPNVPVVFHHESPQIETIFYSHSERMVQT